MTKSVIIAGNFGATNIGDEALLESVLIQLQRSSSEDLLYYVLSSNPEETTGRYAHRYPVTAFPLFPAGPRSIIKYAWKTIFSVSRLRKSSFALFGGGGLFTDEASSFAVFLWWVQFCYMYYILGQRIHILGQSFGPLHSTLGKSLTRFVLKRAKSIYIRDIPSVQVVKELGYSAVYDPDLAFQLDCGLQVRTQTNSEILHIAISLRPWHNSSIADTLLTFFKDLSSERQILLHLVPMQYVREEDVSVLSAFQTTCKEYGINTILHRPATYQDVLDILETCHISFGMRLHFLILSALVCVPCIPLSYSSKVKGVMTELGIASHALSHITVTALKEDFDEIIQDLEGKKTKLKEAVERVKEHSKAVEEILRNERSV